MNAAHKRFISIMVLMLLSYSLKAETPQCAQSAQFLASESLYFSRPHVKSSQAALLSLEGDDFGPLWIKARVSEEGLSFENTLPGLGLPFTLYHVQVKWLDRMGQELKTESFPAKEACAPLSLFPGQETSPLQLKAPNADPHLRVELKVWAQNY